MKRSTVITLLFLLITLVISACSPAVHNDQSPGFLNDIGKTLTELKAEHPECEFVVVLHGFPDFAASCFGKKDADFLYFFFGGHDGDFQKAMDQCEDQLKCAGFITTADVLFPNMKDEMTFEEFFSMIGVDEYEHFGEDVPTAQGWLTFMYQNMEVMINPNEPLPDGGWNITGEEVVKCNAPVSIVDPEIHSSNSDMANDVMFDWL